MTNPLYDMLLIAEPSVMSLYLEMLRIGRLFLAPLFALALVFEFFLDWNFPEVVKKLIIIALFMSFFQGLHQVAVKTSFDVAYVTLKKVDPGNLFLKKWYHSKIRTTGKDNWNFVQKLVIPNLNDLLGTAFYLLARVTLWLVKLIYSTVYHLTYVFAPISAILYFFNWTNGGLKGTVQSSLWCVLMPFVVISIFALVGNGLDDRASNGEFIAGDIETILWLFGVTLVLLVSPVFAWGFVKGEGVAHGAKAIGQVAQTGITNLTIASTRLGSTYGRVKSLIPRRSSKEEAK